MNDIYYQWNDAVRDFKFIFVCEKYAYRKINCKGFLNEKQSLKFWIICCCVACNVYYNKNIEVFTCRGIIFNVVLFGSNYGPYSWVIESEESRILRDILW